MGTKAVRAHQGAVAQGHGWCLGVRPAARGGGELGRERFWTPRSQLLVGRHQTDDPPPLANVPRVGQDAMFPLWGLLSRIGVQKTTCLVMSDEEIFRECWFGGRENSRFEGSYCDRSVPGGPRRKGGQHPGLSPCAQRHSEHVTQLLTVKDEAGQAPLSPSLTKSES